MKLLIRIKPLLTRMGWLGIAEIVIRLTRLITILAMAHFLSPERFGVAAMGLVCFELLRAIAQQGVGAKLIAVADDKLARFNRAGFWLNWTAHLCLAAILGALAVPLEILFGLKGLAVLLVGFVPSLLLLPIVTIKVINVQRAQDMRRIGIFTGVMVSVENLTIPVALIFGADIYAICIAKFIAASVWVFCWLRVRHPVPMAEPLVRDYCDLLKFAGTVTASETTKAMRGHFDVIIAGLFLAPTQFGFYTFAKNAGVGLSIAVVNAANTVVYPWFSRLREARVEDDGRQIAFALALGLCLVFVMQALMSLWYVPFFFDDVWHDAAFYVALICLSAVPRCVIDVRGIWLRAMVSPAEELLLHMRNTAIFILCLLVLVTVLDVSGALTFAICLTISHLIALAGWQRFPASIGVSYERT
ncbi:MAG: oligosaccharide flippase family protein [Pseudomonadota bacterium]